jgi:hypothetical protein
MCWNTTSAFTPVELVQQLTRSYVCSATDGGEEYVAAVKACVDVISEQIAPEQFREALLRAADEAGIAALTVVH